MYVDYGKPPHPPHPPHPPKPPKPPKPGDMTVIANINHETGDLTQYTSTVTGGGDLSVASAAALAGTSYGLSVLINDTTAIYGQKTFGSASSTGVIRARLYYDPNSSTLAVGSDLSVWRVYNGSNSIMGAVQAAYNSGYYVRGYTSNDASGGVVTNYVLITDAPHYIEIQITRASTDVSADGSLRIWIDGTLGAGSKTNIDNYDTFTNLTYSRMGALAGIGASTSGTLFLDELIINDDGSQIGPFVPTFTTSSLFVSSSRIRTAQGARIKVVTSP